MHIQILPYGRKASVAAQTETQEFDLSLNFYANPIPFGRSRKSKLMTGVTTVGENRSLTTCARHCKSCKVSSMGSKVGDGELICSSSGWRDSQNKAVAFPAKVGPPVTIQMLPKP